MELDQVFGQTFACGCGRTHAIDPQRVVMADDAIARLPELLAGCTEARRIAVIADRRTLSVAGEATAAVMAAAGWAVQVVCVRDRGDDPLYGGPVCDDHTRSWLDERLEPVDMLLAVGSGVINDLTKWVAHDRDRPYIVFATAASMNGYTSANVAPTIAGVKSLIRARPPQAVVAALPVIASAPARLTSAGFGDVLAKGVSNADWLCNHHLFDDYHCDRAVELIADIEPRYRERPESIADGEGDAIGALFEALLLTGAAMTMAGSSAPASGGEHLISHTVDMMAARDGIDHDLHGRQVGVGTVLAAALYERVLAVERPRLVDPPPCDAGFWGAQGEMVARASAGKAERISAARTQLADPAAWDALRRRLAARVPRPAMVQDRLRRARAAMSAADLGIDSARLATALAHAHEIRSRFTVLDLARLLGILPDAAPELVAQWAR